jgi:hypothetical protein
VFLFAVGWVEFSIPVWRPSNSKVDAPPSGGAPHFWISGFLDFWISGFLDFWISGFLDFWISGAKRLLKIVAPEGRST